MSFLFEPRTPSTQGDLEIARAQAREMHRLALTNEWMGPGPSGKYCICGMPSEARATEACKALELIWVPGKEDQGVESRPFDTRWYTKNLRNLGEAARSASNEELPLIRDAAVEIFRLKYGNIRNVVAPTDRGALINFLAGATELVSAGARSA